MTIYTVQSIDDLLLEPLDHRVVGSYTTRERALDKCVDYIIGRLSLRGDLAWSMAHDENHPEAGRFFSKRREDGATVVRKGRVGKLRKLLRDELGELGRYYVWDGESSWHFDIDENHVEGELWHTVFPGTFTSEEDAAEAFISYVKGLCGDDHMKWSDELVRETRSSLKKDGRAQVDLRDGRSVSCVLRRGDADNARKGKR